ncbi:MAG TPA: hypothetical protein VGN28_03680 [Blastococcus sp.]|jgi:hypothetical protein|nr:hypothetical protein [Blastococcus sp.]
MTSVIDPKTTTGGTTTPPSLRRNRRLAVAAAVLAVAAGAVVWITVGTDPASADRHTTAQATASRSAAAPSLAAPSGSPAPTAPAAADPAVTASAAPSAAKAPNSAAVAPAPAGWESRTFQGVTFSVPPGAVAPDAQDPGNADVPPSFVWTGPSVGDGSNAQITVRILPADQAPTLGSEYQVVTVPGADQAHLRTGSIDSQPPMTAVDVNIVAANRFINVTGMFAAGPVGEQMVRDLVASLRIG